MISLVWHWRHESVPWPRNEYLEMSPVGCPFLHSLHLISMFTLNCAFYHITHHISWHSHTSCWLVTSESFALVLANMWCISTRHKLSKEFLESSRNFWSLMCDFWYYFYSSVCSHGTCIPVLLSRCHFRSLIKKERCGDVFYIDTGRRTKRTIPVRHTCFMYWDGLLVILIEYLVLGNFLLVLKVY